jgi:NADPH:quinone reductase-like Zn-dependent oxidoreductase
MCAWVVTQRGNPIDVLKLKMDYPVPVTPKGSDLLIRITHACLNPADIFLCSILPTWLPCRRNPIPGFDFAGRVELAGPSAPKEFVPNAEVCASLSLVDVLAGRGTLAEFVLLSSDMVSLKPKELSLAASSGLGITGQTVVIMLNEAKIKEGDRILINGSSGGVGTLLVQVAKAKGAHVTATCSKANISMVKQLGADEVCACV